MELSPKEDGNRAVNFTSTSELNVLVTGLKVIREVAAKGANQSGLLDKEIGVMTQFVTDFSAVHDRLVSEPRTREIINEDRPVMLEFGVREHVHLAELAVRIVASNEPGVSTHPDLQDPIRYGFAQNMAAEYADAADAAGVQVPGYNAPAEQ